jgi:hypothetical protein
MGRHRHTYVYNIHVAMLILKAQHMNKPFADANQLTQ